MSLKGDVLEAGEEKAERDDAFVASSAQHGAGMGATVSALTGTTGKIYQGGSEGKCRPTAQGTRLACALSLASQTVTTGEGRASLWRHRRDNERGWDKGGENAAGRSPRRAEAPLGVAAAGRRRGRGRQQQCKMRVSVCAPAAILSGRLPLSEGRRGGYQAERSPSGGRERPPALPPLGWRFVGCRRAWRGSSLGEGAGGPPCFPSLLVEGREEAGGGGGGWAGVMSSVCHKGTQPAACAQGRLREQLG